MRPSTVLAALGLSLALSCTALAQSAAKAAPAAAPDPAALKTAREIVAQMQGDRAAVLASMATPMAGVMQQMGVREPDRAQVLVQEVVMPVLSAHYDELLDIQARSYAGVLAKEDLDAIGAFYATPAGRRLAAVQPQLAQAQIAGMSQWVGTLAPELQGKILQAIQTHGWAPAGQAKPR